MIDAHQHFWRIGEHDCTWPTEDLVGIHRNFMPEDLAPLAKATGVTGSVLVQSQESDLDTDFLLQLANESELIKAVVGWVELLSPVAPIRIRLLAQHPKLRGLRPMLQGLEDPWILNPQLDAAIAEMKACNLRFDALVKVRQLPYLQIFAERHSELAIVIDHAAKPNIAANEFEPWSNYMAGLAALPNVHCKLSGLLTEANAEQGLGELKVYADRLYELFGAERLMWGSDWPVLNLAANKRFASYEDWFALTKELFPNTLESERDAIFGLTAKRFYGF